MSSAAARARITLLATGIAALVGCGQPEEEMERPPAVAFDTTGIRIETATDTFPLTVEVARSEAQRTQGLMERRTLSEDAGMIFLFEEPQGPEEGFWMFRTRIPLDIAYLDGEGRIVAIRQMEPCQSTYAQACRAESSGYAPGAPYSAALEVNRGWLEERSVGVGDRVVLPEAETP